MIFFRKFVFSIVVIMFQLMFLSEMSIGADLDIPGHFNGCFVESPYSTPSHPIFLYRTNNGFVVFEKGKVTYQRIKAIEKKADPLLVDKFIPGKIEVSNTVLTFNENDSNCDLIGKGKLPYNVNYFLSNLPGGKRECDVYASIIMKNVIKGIDVKYYLVGGKLKYDVIVKEKGELNNLKINISGDETLEVVSKKKFKLNNFGFPIEDRISHSYQLIDGDTVDIDVNFEVAANEIKFKAEDFDTNYEMIIDPSLSFSTFVGGSDADYEYTGGISKDAAGNIVVTGRTYSVNFPTTAGVIQINSGGDLDCIVFKLNSTGSALLFCTYIGGSNVDAGYTSLVDQSNGNIFIGGTTGSFNFPVSIGSYQSTYGGSLYDGFVVKLNSNGNVLVKSTFVGVSVQDLIASICFDNTGGIVFVGQTTDNFISTGTGYQNAFGGGPWDVFVGKISNSLTTLSSTTMIGGAGDDHCHSVKVDAIGNIYIMGMTSGSFPVTSGSYSTIYKGGVWDTYCAKFNTNLSQLIFSTYVGSTGNDWVWNSMDIDNSGNMYVTGYTNGANFPTTPGVIQTNYGGGSFDAFVYKLNSLGNSLIYSTYFGANGDDEGWGIALDNNSPIITGCFQGGMQTTPCSYSSLNNGQKDAFVLKLNSNFSSIEYDSYFGGSTNDQGYNVLLDGSDIIIAGSTYSSDFPVTSGCYDSTSNGADDFFVLKLSTASSGALPNAQFSTQSFGCVGKVFNFNNSSMLGVNYSWDFGDGITSTLFQPTHSYNSNGSYSVMLIVENCYGKDTAYQTIQINSIPSPTFTYQDDCNGILFFNADSSALSYNWNFGGLGVSNLDSVNFNFGTVDSATVTLIVSNGAGCSDTLSKLIYLQKKAVASFTATVLPCTYEIFIDPDTTNSTTYNWNVGGSLSQNAGQNFNVTITSIGDVNIELIVGSGGCKDTLIKTVHLDSLPSAQFSVFQTCINPVQFVNNSSFYNNLMWYFGDGDSSNLINPNHQYLQSGSYDVTIIVNDQNGCKDTITKNVNAFNPPIASFSTLNVLCSKDIQLFVDSLSAGNYQWNFNGNQFSNLGQDFIYSFDSAGVYNIELVVDSGGCSDTMSKVIIIDSIPDAKFAVDNDCSNPIQLTNLSSSYNSIKWSFGDNDSSSFDNPTHQYLEDGIYNVSLIVMDSIGCSDTLNIEVNAHSKQVVDLVSVLDSCSGKYRFFVEPDNLANSYLWEFGDGLTSTNVNPEHIYSSLGIFNPLVIINPNAVCSDTISTVLDVTVSENNIPYLPNCFTPNNDGKNDYFEIEGNSFCEYDYYSVYSRWGQLLFKSKSLFEKWDGKKDGFDLPEGIYVIIFEGKKSFISFVTILR
ncbi:MAG TPA: PKD domain-containing protein [Bacteroidia bacterium]|nr:PKD domain-containing protein [Bacteroidia bacterium]